MKTFLAFWLCPTLAVTMSFENVLGMDLAASASPIDPGSIVCHRGERNGGAPDNSAEAFKAAVSAGFGFECDIRMDAGGRVFCAHDANEDPACATTFAEAVSLARDGWWVVIDVKGNDPAIVPAAKRILDAQSAATPSNLFFTCTNLALVKALREGLPQFKTTWLTGCALDGDFPERAMTAGEMIRRLRESGASGVTLSDRAEIFTDAYLREIADAGFEIHLCTFESLSCVQDAFRRGAKTVTLNNARGLRFVALNGLEKDSAGSVRTSLQTAIDRIAATGGGTAVLPPGRYMTGSIRLMENVTLRLEKGAEIIGDKRTSEYEEIRLGTSRPGEKPWQALIFAENARNTGVEGEGVIDGNGSAFSLQHAPTQPIGLLFNRCRQVCVKGITLKNTASWGVCLKECIDVTARGLTVRSNAHGNSEGIDIESSWVLVEDCSFDCGSNAVCMRNDNPDFTVRNVTVRRCRIASP